MQCISWMYFKNFSISFGFDNEVNSCCWYAQQTIGIINFKNQPNSIIVCIIILHFIHLMDNDGVRSVYGALS